MEGRDQRPDNERGECHHHAGVATASRIKRAGGTPASQLHADAEKKCSHDYRETEGSDVGFERDSEHGLGKR